MTYYNLSNQEISDIVESIVYFGIFNKDRKFGDHYSTNCLFVSSLKDWLVSGMASGKTVKLVIED